MLNTCRHTNHPLRFWLIAAAAVLLLVAVLEAGHIHGIFTQTDDHCTLCQHGVALDKAITVRAQMALPVLQVVLALNLVIQTIAHPCFRFIPIRAPPTNFLLD